ncbi:iron chelate uptake ABC transporter family permease subunit [Nesterenkonia xinjiangensis]
MTVMRIGTAVALSVDRRAATVTVLIWVLVLALVVFTLGTGPQGSWPAAVISHLRGVEGDAAAGFVLERLRGPRVIVAVGVGVALGLAGALFQTVTRNPLGSPDVIGLGAGAGAGVALATLWWPGQVPAMMGAVLGAGAAALLVHQATGRGFSSPARVIVTGIAVSAMAHAITQYVVAVGLRDSAHQLAAYLVGSLGTRTFQDAGLIGASLLVLAPLVLLLSHRLTLMDLGDDLADSLGVGAVRVRTAAIILAVLLAAVAVAVAGPIAFVALTAPHIARRLTRRPGANLAASATLGALIVVSADLLVQQLSVLDGLPVGIVTAGLGGVYLGYLLIHEWRKASA